jgi:hypothetical protein
VDECKPLLLDASASGEILVQGGAAVRTDDLPPELVHMVRRHTCCLLIIYRCTFAAVWRHRTACPLCRSVPVHIRCLLGG